MITPRSTRLIRVSGLQAFRRAIVRLVGEPEPPDPRPAAVILPSRSAAEQLGRAIERVPLPASPAAIAPELLTRDEWFERLCRWGGVPPLLAAHEREILLEASARDARDAGFVPPFRLRPGLVSDMLAFYDAMRRHGRSHGDLDRVAGEMFAPDVETDGGAARLLEQAQFLAEAFRRYEARLAGAGRMDEHRARERVLASPTSPFRHVIVAVGDSTFDTGGLWPADFDLLTRLNGLDRVDVVATDARLAAGLLPRLRRWLPEMSEELDPAPPTRMPVLTVSADSPDGVCTLHRDREEEVASVAGLVTRAARRGRAGAERTGIVFRRPLPYVYLTARVFEATGLIYDAFDALPLAAEPYAAALDVVIACVEEGFRREALLAVLRSPHFACAPGGRPLPPHAAASLDRALAAARYLGEVDRLLALAGTWIEAAASGGAGSASLATAAQAAVDVARALAPVAGEVHPSTHVTALLRFLDRFEVRPASDVARDERQARARAAVRQTLVALEDAYRTWHEGRCAFADTASRIRRVIEQQTFSPRVGGDGVLVLDAAAARFADLDWVFLVGLVRTDWPDRRRRNIFFPSACLKHLGWPDEADFRAEVRAEFEDLIGLAASRVSVSAFLLEHDAIVESSMLLDDLRAMHLATDIEEPATGERRQGCHDPEGAPVVWLPEADAAWHELRQTRTPPEDPRYHGRTGGAARSSYRVSAIDRYLDCPFKYFAAEVLRLGEEPADEESIGPRGLGQATHEVLQRFFDAWQRAGRGAITPESLADARSLFETVVGEAVAGLAPADAAWQRAGLLGSPLDVGAGDIVFQHEIERPAEVVERLLEFPLDGETVLRSGGRTRRIEVKARADRIDLLEGGTFRLVDYKLRRAPAAGRSIQLAAYAAAARARLAGHRGRDWQPADAVYVTFGRPPHVHPASRHARSLDADLAAAEGRFVAAVEGIEQGLFPPRPVTRRLCATCAYAGVCRKDYADDE